MKGNVIFPDYYNSGSIRVENVFVQRCNHFLFPDPVFRICAIGRLVVVIALCAIANIDESCLGIPVQHEDAELAIGITVVPGEVQLLGGHVLQEVIAVAIVVCAVGDDTPYLEDYNAGESKIITESRANTKANRNF